MLDAVRFRILSRPLLDNALLCSDIDQLTRSPFVGLSRDRFLVQFSGDAFGDFPRSLLRDDIGVVVLWLAFHDSLMRRTVNARSAP